MAGLVPAAPMTLNANQLRMHSGILAPIGRGRSRRLRIGAGEHRRERGPQNGSGQPALSMIG